MASYTHNFLKLLIISLHSVFNFYIFGTIEFRYFEREIILHEIKSPPVLPLDYIYYFFFLIFGLSKLAKHQRILNGFKSRLKYKLKENHM